MSTVALVLRAGARDVARSRWIAGYAVALWLLTEALFLFGGTSEQVAVSLLNATLLVVPLVALVFGTARAHAAREFTALLLAQPLSRGSVFSGLYLGLALPLAGAFVAGIVPPMLIHGARAWSTWAALSLIVIAGVLLSLTFTALAIWVATTEDDRLKAMGRALAAWACFVFLLDGLALVLISLFGATPLERPLLLLVAMNPVDLARVLVLTTLDTTALLGYTGALFRQLFGASLGPLLAMLLLVSWAVVPFLLARRRFLRRDF